MKYLIEGHCHTKDSSPCGQVYAKDLVKLYKDKNYNCIIITDHFSYSVFNDSDTWENICNKFLQGYRNAKLLEEEFDIKILLGMEIRFNDSYNDYLVYGIDENFIYSNEWIYMKSLKELKELTKDKYLIVQAHPFRGGNKLADISLLDGIEINNTNPNNICNNHLAFNAWKNTNLIPTAGCDFHSADCISKDEYMLFDELPLNNRHLVELFKSRKYIIKEKNNG